FRGIQGLFGGVLFATVFTVIGDLFPPDQRGRAQGLFGAVFGLSSILGPTTGGFITDHWSWRWVFEVNIPVGIIAVSVVLAGLPYVRSKASWRDIDFWGALTLAAGVVPLLIGLTITRDHAWTSPQVTGLLALAAIMLGAFVFVESRVEHPIVPLHLFKNSTFTVSMVVGFLTAFGMFGSILFTPLVFQGVLGISATNSGALITPMMFGLLGASTATGFLMRRVRYYRFLGTLGVVIMIIGMWMLSQVTPSMPEWRVVLDPALLAKLPPSVVGAIRFALSDTLHDIYLFAGLILVLALVASFFMREVPLTGARPEVGFEAPPVELDEEEREKAVAHA